MTEPFEPRPVSKRKNTRKWCKGKVGVPHVPVVAINERAVSYRLNANQKCYSSKSISRSDRKPVWYCAHHEVCSTCGKELKFVVPCPDNTENIKQLFL